MYRYSHRLGWSVAANSFSLLLAEQQRSGRLLLDLTVSNPTLVLADYPHAEIAAALGAISNFEYRAEPFGNFGARKIIAERAGVSPEDVALTASTSEAYGLLFKLLANPGDEVLVPSPSYPLLDYLAQLEGVTLRPYRLEYDGAWHIDFDSMAEGISGRTRAIVVVNPNNPTGSYLKAAEYRRLSQLAQQHSLPLIADEVFMDYAFRPSGLAAAATLTNRHDVLSFTLNGLSKSAGMPQMKLGWIVVNGPLLERRQACARLELVLDTYLSVSAPVQLSVKRLVHVGDAIRRRLRHRVQNNLESLERLLAGARIHMLHAEGGWSAVLRVPAFIAEEEWITRLLVERGVIVQPGYFFDMPQSGTFLIVSLLAEENVFAEGVTRMLSLTQ